MSSPDPPPPPDYSDLAEASEENAKLAHELAIEQFEWAKTAYADNKELTDEVARILIPTLRQESEAAEADRARYQEVYQPLEDEFIQRAEEYSSPERIATEVGRAQASVAQQFEAARQASQQQLESYGLNPADTRYAALDIGIRTDQAAAAAAAGNEAARATEAQGNMLLSEAINIGRGYPGQIASAYGTSTQAGNSASTNALNTTATGSSAFAVPATYLGQSTSALGTAGNVMSQGYADQMAYYNASNQSSGWGSALGLIGGMAGQAFLGPTAPWIFGEGGTVPEVASPSRGAVPDDVPAAVSAGEYIVPEEVVRWKGEEFFHKLTDKAKTERAQAVPTSTPPPRPQPTAGARPAAQRPVMVQRPALPTGVRR